MTYMSLFLVHSHVILQRSFLGKSFAAYFTCVHKCVFVVEFFMFYQGQMSIKCLITVLTLVFHASMVTFHMYPESLPLRERLGTQSTLERRLPGVEHHVVLQARLLGERSAAHETLMRLQSGVVAHVTLQVGGRGEALVADLAGVRPLSRVLADVQLQVPSS